MSSNCQLSNVSKAYIKSFQCILNDMIQGMTGAELSNSISYNFMVQMIPHHKAAIAMSENLLKYTTDIPLQNIALNIVEEQTKSIACMEKILCSCSKQKNCEQCLCRYQQKIGCIMQSMFSRMKEAETTNDINSTFIHEMIPHHEGAVEMSKTTLQYDICPELTPVLESIISSQEKGIEQMQKLLHDCCIR